MKRISTCLLALLASLLSWADNVEVDGIYYELDYPAKTASVTYNMVVAGNYETYSGDVVIPEKITYNGDEFVVTEIGPQAFLYSKSLTSVVIPETVTLIQANAFGSCTGLTSIDIPNSVKEFGGFVFSSCSKLKTVHLGNGIKELGGRIFQGCTKLESINLPEGLTSINDYAFEVCRSLKSIDIPSTVSHIDAGVFRACDAMETMRVSPENPWFDSRGGCNAIIETATNKLVAGCHATVIPNTVTSIGDLAFKEIRGLASLTIPGNVKFIGYSAFEKTTLTDLTLDEGVKTIDNYAFYNNDAMTSVSLPSTLTSIGEYGFNDCMYLNKVIAYMPEPFQLNGAVFGRNAGTCVLYVPQGTRDAYIENGWNENQFMGGVVEMDDETGIGAAGTDSHLSTVRKVLNRNRITIITPDNRKFSIDGSRIK